MQIQKPNTMFNAILWLFTAISINAKQRISVIHPIITKKLTVFNGQAYFFREKEVIKCLFAFYEVSAISFTNSKY